MKILGFMLEKVTRGWRILHNKELHDIFSSINIINVLK